MTTSSPPLDSLELHAWLFFAPHMVRADAVDARLDDSDLLREIRGWFNVLHSQLKTGLTVGEQEGVTFPDTIGSPRRERSLYRTPESLQFKRWTAPVRTGNTFLCLGLRIVNETLVVSATIGADAPEGAVFSPKELSVLRDRFRELLLRPSGQPGWSRWAPFVGRMACHVARTPDGHTTTEPEIERTMEDVLVIPGDLGLVDDVHRLDAGEGVRIGYRDGVYDEIALVFPKKVGESKRLQTLLYDVLPVLAMYLRKVVHQWNGLFEAAPGATSPRDRLLERERALSAAVFGAGRSATPTLLPSDEAGSLERLERSAVRVAAAHADLAIAIHGCQLDQVRHSVGVNQQNFLDAVRRSDLSDEGPVRMWRDMVSRDVRAVEELRELLHAAVAQADMFLRSLQVQAEVQRTKVEEKENRLSSRRNTILTFVGLGLGLLGFLELFDGDFAKAAWKTTACPHVLKAWFDDPPEAPWTAILAVRIGAVCGVALAAAAMFALKRGLAWAWTLTKRRRPETRNDVAEPRPSAVAQARRPAD